MRAISVTASCKALCASGVRVERAEIGRVGELIEIVGDSGLAKLAKHGGERLVILKRSPASATRWRSRAIEEPRLDVGAERTPGRIMLQPQTLLGRQAQRERRWPPVRSLLGHDRKW